MRDFADSNAPAVILVVDDEAINRVPLVTILIDEGYRVLEAANGQEALDIVNAGSVDMVLLDVVMPVMDGFETCEHIRAQEDKTTLPVVFFTALEDRVSRVRGKEVGGDDFLTKPVDPLELTVRVKNLLKIKAYSDLLKQHSSSLELELKQVKEQLCHINRMANLGTLAAAVGHELQSTYGVFNATLDFIQSDLAAGQKPNAEDLENLEGVRKHMRNHAASLLNMGRPWTKQEVLLDFREIVLGTLQLLKSTGKTRRVEISTRFPDEPVMVMADPTRMEQVVMNLVNNAVDAMADNEAARKIDIQLDPTADPAWIHCILRNNGPPIPESKIDRIFESFYTTREGQGGTGLGLSVVRHILDTHGGRITAGNEPDGGVSFVVSLPAPGNGSP